MVVVKILNCPLIASSSCFEFFGVFYYDVRHFLTMELANLFSRSARIASPSSMAFYIIRVSCSL